VHGCAPIVSKEAERWNLLTSMSAETVARTLLIVAKSSVRSGRYFFRDAAFLIGLRCETWDLDADVPSSAE